MVCGKKREVNKANFGVCRALKGQLHIAQGDALGFKGFILTYALKGQLHDGSLGLERRYIIRFMQLPFQGASYLSHYYPGRCPGLCAVALSGRGMR